MEGDCNEKAQSTHNFDIERMAYQLEFKNTGGMYVSCKFCDKQQCKGCLVPFTNDETMNDLLNKYNLTRNDTLFSDLMYQRGKEVICQVTWHPSISQNLFDFLAAA